MLGVGGLVKAYTDCSKAVIAQAEIIEKEVIEEISLQLSQEKVPEFLKACSQQNIKIIDQVYADTADFKVAVNVVMAEEFKMRRRIIPEGK
jgi:putative IMPACT (imprinted ancient) family translation regulator